jgi:hypothetical protein
MKDKFEETFEKKSEKKYEPKASDTVRLVFKELRSFDLHVDRVLYHFNGQEEKTVPRSVLTSPDFNEQVREFFLVRED